MNKKIGLARITGIACLLMAVTRRRGETAMQALGAMPVYELLAEYTLKTKIAPDKCFQRYLEWRAGRKKK